MNKVYNTEIISVGTELLLGHVTNTDARDISELLSQIGINVLYHTVVGDNPGRLEKCIAIAKQRADIIITTGGLGPTCDDLTKEMLAQSFGLALVRNEEEFKALYDYISYRHKYTENNTKQALLPEGCTVFHNTCGTAPGCAFEKDGTIVIMLPGPPKECLTMMKVSVIPYLKKLSDEVIVSHAMRIFGIGESAVDDIFAEEMNRMANPTLAPYAKEADCLLQVTAKAASEEEAEAMCRPVMEHIREKLGEYVYGVDVDCIEESVLALLLQNPMTLAFAEGFTGGEIAKRFTDLSASGPFFKAGFAASQPDSVSQLLGIDRDVLLTEHFVSAEIAAEMAENVRTLLGADIGIGITGVGSPEDDPETEPGTVFLALATENETFVKELHLGAFRTRSFVRRMAGNYVYDMLRRYLTGLNVI